MTPWIDVAGWTLVHFVWQGAAIAGLAAAAFGLLRDRSPQARYAVGCGALLLMIAAPLVTAGVLSRSLAVAWSAVPAAIAQQAGGSLDAVPNAAAILLNLAMARGLSSIDVGAPPSGIWLSAIVGLWMLGVAVFLVRLFGGWWRIHRLHRVSRVAAPSPWSQATTRLARSLGVSTQVHVIDSSLVDTPTVIGWMKPVILLPAAALAGLSVPQVEGILAHELAHIRRHDFLVNLLQVSAETILFYHPAVWWISSRVRTEREHCCDLVALSVCGDAVSYADALVELESWRTTPAGLAVAATGGTLKVRVRRLLGAPAEDRPSFGAAMIAGVVTIVCVAGTSAYLLAAQPSASPEPNLASAADPAAWSMVFNHEDSTMRFIGFRGRDLVRFAYQVPQARVVGGPRWLDEQILRLVVNLDSAPRADQMPRIVREALESRLQMKAHVEKRPFPVLALVNARADGTLGPGLRAATRACFDVAKWVADGQPSNQLPERRGVPACGAETDTPLGWTQYASISMPQFAEELRDYVRGWPMTPRESHPRPAHLGPLLVEVAAPEVVDRTGLTGRYDVEFSAFYPTAALMSRFPFLTHAFESLGFTSIPRALSSQLGLALVESEAPYDVVVIDQVERP